MLLEGVCVNETSVEAPALSDKAKQAMEKADITALSKPMLKEDEEFKLPEANLDPNADDKTDEKPVKENDEDNTNDNNDNSSDNNNSSSDDNKDADKDENKSDDGEKKDEKKELTDEEKKEKRAAIVGIEAFNLDGDNTTEEEKEENRENVVDIEGVPADDDNKSDDDKKDSDDEVPSEDAEQTDECDGANATTQETDQDNDAKECDGSQTAECGDQEECGPGDVKVKDGSKDSAEAKKVLNDADKSEDIKKQTEKDMDKYDELIKKAKKLADVKESIVNVYPFSISLSPENFAKFAALKPVDKNKVQKYIVEHEMFDSKTINEQWTTPLVEEKRNKKNWLRLAPKEYREAYAKAAMDVQDAIEESAKLVNIQTAADAQRFWELTGLLRSNDDYLQKSLTEQFAITESEETNLNESAVRSQNLGYSVDYMGMLEQMADAGMI